MSFHPGQRVQTRDKKIVGTVEKKLTSLDDVYVVLLEHASRREEKLVRGEDLEPFAEEGNSKLA